VATLGPVLGIPTVAEEKDLMDEKYRVFISYSHVDEDETAADKIAKALQDNGLIPVRDKGFAYGWGFHEQIRAFIAHAHVFLPFITEYSTKRNWVQQEIGFAMALNVPVLPLVKSTLPEGMPSLLHALEYSEDDEELKAKLSAETIQNLVARCRDAGLAPYNCAELAEDRAILMTQYANEVRDLGFQGRVRQRGGLSSLHIPNSNLSDSIWKERYGNERRSRFHCRELRREHVALSYHARTAGFRLIINPEFRYRKFGDHARKLRLQTLIEYLEPLTEDNQHENGKWKYAVVFDPDLSSTESTTIVGDWFSAESVSRKEDEGYRQTIFTRHAPSMRCRIALFDLEFNDLLTKSGWSEEESLVKAIQELKDRVEELGETKPPEPHGDTAP